MEIKTKARFTFRGGVHPPDEKKLTQDCPIKPGPVSKQLAILLSQHIGAPCKPTVTKKDHVTAGQLIGTSDAFISAPVHSPAGGTVKDIALQSHPVIGRAPAVIIDVETENNPQKQPPYELFTENFDENDYQPEQILEAVRQAGIVGMGGAGFPAWVKIAPNPRLPKHTIIVNGCECEPFITCDYRIMLEWTHQLIAGVRLIKKASGCENVLIGIEDNKPAAIDAISSALNGTDNINVVSVGTKYPQGGERQLINAILKKQVPTGGIPPMIGLLVTNVATAAAVAEAVVTGRPLTHRVVTVGGYGIEKPGNLYVTVGMPVGELIEFCGGLTKDAVKVVLGGPMMGLAIADLTTPITKTTGAVTVLTKKGIGKAKFENIQTACIRCGRCIEVCPENLNPTKIAHAVKHDLLDVAQQYYMSACIECGCCSYVCPANIELTGYIKTGKTLLAREQKKIPE